MNVSTEPETSYAGVLAMSALLLLFVGMLSVLVPVAHLNRAHYQHYALFPFIAYTPVLLIIKRRWFRVVAGLYSGGWIVFVSLPLLVWVETGPGIVLLLLPVPLIVAWFLPPAPVNARTFLTIIGSATIAVVTVAAVSANMPEEGDVVHVCTDGFVDARITALYVPDPRPGFGLPPGVRAAGAAIGGHAFHFDPFTPSELEAFVAKAEQVDFVTEVRINEQCPPWP